MNSNAVQATLAQHANIHAVKVSSVKIVRRRAHVKTVENARILTEIVAVCLDVSHQLYFANKMILLIVIMIILGIGDSCESPCKNGTWGQSCQNKCNCFNNAQCRASDGLCVCRPGFFGTKCEEFCPEGFYGAYCIEACNCLKKNSVCHPAQGCICKNGFSGEHCDSMTGEFTADGELIEEFTMISDV